MSEKALKIITHNGGFHADDAFAVATLLLYLKGRATVTRTRNPQIIAAGDFVVDVGGEYDEARNRFDHHQPGGAGVCINGIPYAAFGLVWKKFGTHIAGSAEAASRIDTLLIQPIDAFDNGVQLGIYDRAPTSPYLIQNIMFALEPAWNEHQRSLDQGFTEACTLAQKILEREIIHIRAELEGEGLVLVAYERAPDKRLIVLDAPYEWESVLAQKAEPLFVITPERGGSTTWRAHTVRTDLRSFVSRRPFPPAWAGKTGAQLAAVSGVPDALFCHNKLFTVSARTKEGAVALARKALTG